MLNDSDNTVSQNDISQVHDLLYNLNERVCKWEQIFEGQAKKDVAAGVQKFSHYWSNASKDYYNASIRWFAAAVVFAAILAFVFLSSKFEFTFVLSIGNTYFPTNLVKTILVSTLLIWGIRISTKGGMTAIHLARKAAEKATAADAYTTFLSSPFYRMAETDVTVVFKYLFSEAKTGLFKDEGPALPLDICINTVRNAASPKDG